MKYPWLQQSDGYESEKWRVYQAEQEQFESARTIAPYKNSKTLEAEIMDWADDVAYAVYDLDDFYRAGLIPLDRLLEQSSRHLDQLFASIRNRWERQKRPVSELDAYRGQFEKLLHVLGTREALRDVYIGTTRQRAALRDITSFLVNRYAGALSLATRQDSKASSTVGLVQGTSPVTIVKEMKQEVTILKQLAWTYVIENPSLAAQQEGQKEIIKVLFGKFGTAAEKGHWNIFPASIRNDLIESRVDWKSEGTKRIRVVIDLIASMTEIQAFEMYRRLTGQSFGSVMHGIIR